MRITENFLYEKLKEFNADLMDLSYAMDNFRKKPLRPYEIRKRFDQSSVASRNLTKDLIKGLSILKEERLKLEAL